MKTLEFSLGFKEDRWFCSNSGLHCEASELNELDNLLIEKLREHYPNQKIQIKYYFDFNSFPLWMRQYMPHYFNRNFTVNLIKNNNTYESVK